MGPFLRIHPDVYIHKKISKLSWICPPPPVGGWWIKLLKGFEISKATKNIFVFNLVSVNIVPELFEKVDMPEQDKPIGNCSQPIDLDKLKTFYDPHPGFAGAFLPIPTAVRKVAEELNGKTMTLAKALAKIRAVTTGKVELVEDYNYISLDVTTGSSRSYYRVIRYN